MLPYQVGPSSLGGQELITHFKKMTEVVMKALEIASCLFPSACSPLTPTLLSAASYRKLASS